MSGLRRGIIDSTIIGSPPPPSTPILGFYTVSNTVSGVESLASTLSVSAELKGYSTYCDGSTWSSIAAGPQGFGSIPSGGTLLLGVDLTPNGVGCSAVPSNLSTFRSLASILPDNTICRVGWEFDIATGPWGAGVNGNTPALYVTASQAAIGAMKGVNSTLKFDFCCNTGTSSLSQLETYYGSNGDAYWDYIGGDHYGGNGANFSAMGACVNLAALRGKPLSCGEWGVLADNPTFINDAAQVFLDPAAASSTYGWPAYTVAYHSYFSAAYYNSDITSYPNAAAAYTADFSLIRDPKRSLL